MILGLDIDGVLADFITPFLRLLAERTGTGPIDPASVTDPNFTAHPFLTLNDFRLHGGGIVRSRVLARADTAPYTGTVARARLHQSRAPDRLYYPPLGARQL